MYFSINVDECMSNADKKMFYILNSHFSEKEMRSVVQHYKFQTFDTVNAKTLL